MPRRKELENYRPPLTKEEILFRKKLSIVEERHNHNKPTLQRRENRDELR